MFNDILCRHKKQYMYRKSPIQFWTDHSNPIKWRQKYQYQGKQAMLVIKIKLKEFLYFLSLFWSSLLRENPSLSHTLQPPVLVGSISVTSEESGIRVLH